MKLNLVSAWNDSGGGFLTRLLDGVEGWIVWPYELMLGNTEQLDGLSNLFHAKYRWPKLGSDLLVPKAERLFGRFIDEETKSVATEGTESKHAPYLLDIDIDSWRSEYIRLIESCALDQPRDYIEAYLNPIAERCHNYNQKDLKIIAHCPSIILDAHRIWSDFPSTKIVHVVRDPGSCFRDFRRRHPDFDRCDYAHRWLLTNTFALNLSVLYPERVKLVGFKSLIFDRPVQVNKVCRFLDLSYSPNLLTPSWQGRELSERNMGPFGGVSDIELATQEGGDLEENALNDSCLAVLDSFRHFGVDV